MGYGRRFVAYIVGVLFVLLPLALAAGAKPTKTMVTWDGRKLVVYDHSGLVFYDGLAEDARAIAEVPCKGMRVVPSIQGKYVALVSQFIRRERHVELYDSSGRQIGAFDLDDYWTVWAVSDSGPWISLVKQSESETYPFVRIVDSRGNVMYNFTHRAGGAQAAFAGDGRTYVWGTYVTEQTAERRAFLLLLHPEVKVQWEREFEPDTKIRHVSVSTLASRIVLAASPLTEVYAKSMLTYDVATGSFRSLPLPTHYEGVIKDHVAISPDGRLGVVRVGATRIILLDLEDAKLLFDRDLEALPSGRRLKLFIEAHVDNKANVVLAGVLQGKFNDPEKDYAVCRCDARGDLIGVRVYGGVRSGLHINSMLDGQIAILQEWGPILDLW